jgi:hypothetical protein
MSAPANGGTGYVGTGTGDVQARPAPATAAPAMSAPANGGTGYVGTGSAQAPRLG